MEQQSTREKDEQRLFSSHCLLVSYSAGDVLAFDGFDKVFKALGLEPCDDLVGRPLTRFMWKAGIEEGRAMMDK